MPYQMWKHYCAKSEKWVLRVGRVCSDCGQLGEYDGWHFSVVERWAAFKRLTGIPPIGPHMKRLPPITRECEKCNGKGLIDVDESYRDCPECDATGKVLVVTQEELEKIQRWANELIASQTKMGELEHKSRELPKGIPATNDPVERQLIDRLTSGLSESEYQDTVRELGWHYRRIGRNNLAAKVFQRIIARAEDTELIAESSERKGDRLLFSLPSMMEPW